jgi:hypothetical protein
MGDFIEEVTKAGVLLAADGLTPTSAGKRIKLENGKLTVTDGPFTESKELVASYALYQVDSYDQAVYWTKRFLEVLGGGEVEIRPIFEATDFSEEVFPAEEREREERTREAMERNARG